ncbi:MAG: methionyl-tRNA formyltransferase, partial [Steroidobacteraceae bacterium]|nr:methionyl-tRNA formyltransferase [Steroidobacteraceae bacterium]
PAGRGRTLGTGPVKRRALELGLRVEQPSSLKSEEAVAVLASFAPDLMVVVAYGLILPQAVLDVPRLGCVNIHASLLPRWRGAAPIQRAILAGDTRTGVTIMKMDAGLDTGPMLLIRETGIAAGEAAGSLHDRIARLGAEAVVEAVAGLAAGSLVPVPQPADGATYAAKIRKEEATIDWDSPASAIVRQVRAFNPWPVAETRWQGRQLRIWEARPLTEAPGVPAPGAAGGQCAPGQVIEAEPGRLVVSTGDGFLEVHRLQLAGRNAMPAAEFLNANPLVGEKLG